MTRAGLSYCRSLIGGRADFLTTNTQPGETIMDYFQFEDDVWAAINEGLYTDQFGTMVEDHVVITIGETETCVLFGAEENAYGQSTVLMFDSFEEQIAWFEAVTANIGPAY